MLIGRHEELAQLTACLHQVESGPRLAVVQGPPGIGKTALLRAWTDGLDFAVHWAQAIAEEGTPPYWLWRQWLGDRFEAPATEEPSEYFRWLAAQLQSEGPGARVLVADDIQWADESSLRALLSVLRNGTPALTWLVCAGVRTGTDDGLPPWRELGAALCSASRSTDVHLGPLGPSESASWLNAVAPSTPSAHVRAAVYELTRGNPLYVREVGRALRGEVVRLPDSLASAIRERIHEISPEGQRLLRAAAVLGETFEVAVVAGVLDEPVMKCLPAIDELITADLLAFSAISGTVSFSHALTRAAIAESLGLVERVHLHHRAALTLERLYREDLDVHLAELARHWAAVAVTGETEPASRWATRAAQFALRSLGPAEAARLFASAADLGTHLTVGERSRLRLAAASAAALADDLASAHAQCREVADVARRAGDPTLLADAALALDVVGQQSWDADVRTWCDEVLETLPAAETSRAAAVRARLAECLVYLGEGDAAVEVSAAALEAAASGDTHADIAALRARQLACSGPEHRAHREALAARMLAIGHERRDASLEMWGLLWRIDTHWDAGRLPAIESDLGALQTCVARLGSGRARWHQLVTRAALAQAQGRFDDSLAAGTEAFELARSIDHHAGYGAFRSLLGGVGRHRGHDTESLETPPTQVVEATEIRAQLFPILGPAAALAESGRIEEARALYRRLGPPTSWQLQPIFRLSLLALGLTVARHIGAHDDLLYFVDRLRHERAEHVVTGGGTGSYLGPLALHIGLGLAELGELDAAQTQLRAAADTSQRIGAHGFAAEAHTELADLFIRARQPAQARPLITTALAATRRLGMTPWRIRLERMVDTIGPRAITPREREVARLVAQGLSNRQIAETLVVSERTAQNHVQNLLTRLGFNNRTQLAAWFTTAAEPLHPT